MPADGRTPAYLIDRTIGAAPVPSGTDARLYDKTIGSRPTRQFMLPKWQAAQRAMVAGQRNARVLICGDSTSWGYGAAGATFGSNLRAFSWPTQMAALLSGASWQSWFGNGDGAASQRYPGADTRINPGSWILAGGSAIGLGLYPYKATAAATFAFTPTTAIDTIEVYYLSDPGNGVGTFSFTVNVDGGASLGTVTSNQAEGFRKATFTTTLGAHTINCVWASGNAFLTGIVAYNSAVKEATILNTAAAAARISDYVSPASAARLYSPLNSIPVLQPDLTIIDLTINDWNTPTDLATYQAAIGTLVTTAKAAGSDVLMLVGNPSNPATRAAIAVQQQYVEACKAVALANALPILDIYAQFGSYDGANAAGLMVDDIHPNVTGYGRIATSVSNLLTVA